MLIDPGSVMFAEFLDGYIEAALSESGDSSNPDDDHSLVDKGFTREHIEALTLLNMEADCMVFLRQVGVYLPEDRMRQAGRDFWFTRQRAGAGFWDGDWDDACDTWVIKSLVAQAHAFNELSLFVEDNSVVEG